MYIVIPYSYLISHILNFTISIRENEKRALNFAIAVSTTFIFSKKPNLFLYKQEQDDSQLD